LRGLLHREKSNVRMWQKPFALAADGQPEPAPHPWFHCSPKAHASPYTIDPALLHYSVCLKLPSARCLVLPRFAVVRFSFATVLRRRLQHQSPEFGLVEFKGIMSSIPVALETPQIHSRTTSGHWVILFSQGTGNIAMLCGEHSTSGRDDRLKSAFRLTFGLAVTRL
jgi:hypothetical protein